MRLFVVTHKNVDLKLRYPYEVIVVGANRNQVGFPLKDNTFDNISDKNPDFCELTALYWIWKNVKDQDIVGIVHYRRFFYRHFKRINELQISKILKKRDAVVSKRMYLPEALDSLYEKSNLSEYAVLLRNIIKSNCQDYIEAYEKVMSSRYTLPYNMLICAKSIFDNYCEWLFKVLFLLEKEVNSSPGMTHVPRAYGYLSENLFRVWALKNKIKYKECYVLNVEKGAFKQFFRDLYLFFRRFFGHR